MVFMRRDAALGIHAEALAGLNALRRRGAEIGGVLIGRRTPERVTIESHLPVECEHRYGPSYLPSETDSAKLASTVSDDHGGLEAVGFYRSDTRTQFEPDSHDAELIDHLFPNGKAIFLLVRPAMVGASQAALYARVGTGFEALGEVSPFPFTDSAPMAPASDAAFNEPLAAARMNPEPEPTREEVRLEAAAAFARESTPAREGLTEHPPTDSFRANDAPPELSDWFAPAEAVRGETAEPHEMDRRVPIWVWVLLVAGLSGLGAILGYLSVTPPNFIAVFIPW
jgi:hypothetical protein